MAKSFALLSLLLLASAAAAAAASEEASCAAGECNGGTQREDEEEESSLLSRPSAAGRLATAPDRNIREAESLLSLERGLPWKEGHPWNPSWREPIKVCLITAEVLCNTVEYKDPLVPKNFTLASSGTTERPLEADPGAQARFEHRLGRALADTQLVQDVTKQFASRLLRVVLGANPTIDKDEVIKDAFGKKCSVHNTGYIGQDPAVIRAKLTGNGIWNIREVWGLVYCFTKNWQAIDKTFSAVSAMTPEVLRTLLRSESAAKRASAAVAERKADITTTNTAFETEPGKKYSWGVPDFIFPPLKSWVRFGFGNVDGGWVAARDYRQKDGCTETSLLSTDEAMFPPLSPNELVAECGAATSCKLQWYPGAGCYDLNEANPYMRVARKLGYRPVAGPSGTTANVLQLARLLGFAEEDMPAFRLAMLAWMLPADDHSFFEILLGAETFVPRPYKIQIEEVDFAQFWPSGQVLRSSWGTRYHAAPLFASVHKHLPAWPTSGPVAYLIA